MHNDNGEYEISITEHVARHAKTLTRKDLKKKFLGDDYESDDEVKEEVDDDMELWSVQVNTFFTSKTMKHNFVWSS